MRLWLGGAVALVLTLGAGGRAYAQVSVTQAWARATPGDTHAGAAYLTATATAMPDRLVGAATPVAGMAEVHVSEAHAGVMTMRPAGPVPLTPGTPVVLAPGGLHIMLMDLRAPLRAGDHFPLTLTFEHAPPVTVEVAVKPAGARQP